jgi:AcrR family transcriptional regulator
MKDKNAVYWKVLNAAIKLDLTRGHARWNMSELARESGVTRSLIYYYFGRNKTDIILESVKLFAKEFSGQTEVRKERWKTGAIASTLEDSRALIGRLPILPAFIYLHRDDKNDIGQHIRKSEEDFRKKLRMFFPTHKETEIEAMFAIVFGFVFAPNVSVATLPLVEKILQDFGK